MKGCATRISLFLLLGTIFWGCVVEDISGGDLAGKTTLNFTISDGSVKTKSSTEATPNEREINYLGILFYDYTTKELKGGAVATISLNDGSSNGIATFQLPEDVRLNAGNYRMLVFTNAALAIHTVSGKGIDALRSFISNESLTSSYDNVFETLYLPSNDRIKAPLPFFGETVFVSDGSSGSSQSINVTLKRITTKFSLTNKVSKSTLDIKGVKVTNYRSRGLVFADAVEPNSVIMHGTVTGHVSTEDAGYTLPKIEGGFQVANEGLYAFPNIAPYAVLGDKETTALLLKASYNGNIDSYYRVNIAVNSGLGQLLQRNMLYNIIISGVTGNGSPTEEDAMESKKDLLEYETHDWEDEDEGIVVDDKGNFLIVSPRTRTFSYGVNEIRSVNVKMNPGAKWVAEITEGAAYFEYIPDLNNSKIATIKTITQGDLLSTLRGKLVVRGIPDGETDPSPLLEQVVTLLHTPESNNIVFLSVDGKQSDFSDNVSGDGEIKEYNVLTGSQHNTWTATPDPTIESLINKEKSFLNGFNGSDLRVIFRRSATIAELTGTLTVKYDPIDGIELPDDVTITFTQGQSTSDITVNPAYTNEIPMTQHFNGYNPLGNSQFLPKTFAVQVMDIVRYPQFKVELFPNLQVDETKLKERMRDIQIAGGVMVKEYVNPPTGVTEVALNIGYTGPGDDLITVPVRVTPLNNSTNTSGRAYYFNINITTSITLPTPALYNPSTPLDPSPIDGHIWIWADAEKTTKLYIYDRNLGAPSITALNPVAYGYTNYFPIENQDFKGDYFSLTDALSEHNMIKGWNLPTQQQGELIKSKLHISKNRVYILSDEKNALGGNIGVFFSIAGYINSPENIYKAWLWMPKTLTPPSNPTASETALTFDNTKSEWRSLGVNSKVTVRPIRIVNK